MLRNTLPLFNLAWYQRFFWDGKASTIEQQIYFPVSAHDEMNLNWKIAANRITNNKFYRNQFSKIYPDTKIDSLLIAKTIAQFLRTLISVESKYDKVIKQETTYTTEEYYGFELVNDQTKGDCLHCHTTDGNGLGTTGGFSNNGLDTFSDTKNMMDKGYENTSGKKSDIGKFKIPSFRNLVFTAPYMHDGRFQTLQQVLDFYSEGVKYSATIDSKMEFVHKGGARLNQKEKHAIIAFLKTMSDSNFVQNKEFSNPFIHRK
jgi:cytochrome c peroxidase